MKKKVVCKPSEWEQTYLQVAKMTLGKEYEVLQEDANSYQIMHDNGLLTWMSKYNFDVVQDKPKETEQPELVQSEYVPNSLKVRCLGDVISVSGKILTSDKIYSVISINQELGFKKYEIESDNGRLDLFTSHHFEIVTDEQLIENIEQLQPDPVNHPTHYNQNGYEVKDLIAAFNLNFFRGNVVKYACRAHLKGAELQDLMKVKTNIDFEIERMTKGKGAPITVETLLGIIYDCVDKIKEMQAQDGTSNG